MPKLSGLDVVMALREVAPEIRVVVLTGQHDARRAKVLLDAGIHGYLPKVTSYRALGDALRKVHAGGRVFELPAPPIDEARAPRPDAQRLTARELEGLTRSAEGGR